MEIKKLNHLDLFSGIGGFALGFERAGMKTVAFAESDKYCRRILNKHWPDVPIYEDVRHVTKEKLESDGIERVDIISGGFPCQDISVAGKRKGIDEKRSGLWSEFARIIGDIQPRYAVVENVTNLLSGDRGRWFGRVLGNLAKIGLDAEWHCIPASSIGAPHERDRVWVVAYHNSSAQTDVSNTPCNRIQGFRASGQQKSPVYDRQILSVRHLETIRHAQWESEPAVGRLVDGLPHRVDRMRALGNAVVPQIPELIARAILEHAGEA